MGIPIALVVMGVSSAIVRSMIVGPALGATLAILTVAWIAPRCKTLMCVAFVGVGYDLLLAFTREYRLTPDFPLARTVALALASLAVALWETSAYRRTGRAVNP